jgi:hypothetical protein
MRAADVMEPLPSARLEFAVVIANWVLGAFVAAAETCRGR